jgi:hypothetical protein
MVLTFSGKGNIILLEMDKFQQRIAGKKRMLSGPNMSTFWFFKYLIELDLTIGEIIIVGQHCFNSKIIEFVVQRLSIFTTKKMVAKMFHLL